MTDPIDAVTLDRELMESIDRLRARPYGKSSLGAVILCSVLIHILFLSLIMFRPMTTSAKLTFGTYYTVDLVRDVDLADSGMAGSALSEGMRGLLGPGREVVLRNKAESRTLPPISRLDTKEKPSKEINKAIDDLKRKMAAAPRRDQVSPAVAGDSDKGGAVREADVMAAYYGAVWSRIKAKWAFPGGLLSGKDFVAVVHVRIMRSGATEGIFLEKRSPNALFNESAVKAVRKASPFPPLPAGIRDSSIEVGIRFHSSQLGGGSSQRSWDRNRFVENRTHARCTGWIGRIARPS